MLAVVLLCGAALADMPGGMPVMDEAAFDARAGEQPTGPSDGSAPVMPAPDAADAAMQGGSASAPSVGSTSSGGQYVPPSVAFAHHNAKPTPKPSPSVAYFGFPTGGFSQNNIFKSPTEKLDWEKSVLLSRRRRVVVPTTVAPTPAPTPKKGPTWPSYFKRITKAPSGAHVVAKRPPAQPSQMCGATTSQRTTYWKLHGTGGLYFDVTTTHCKFKSRPVYISSVVGDQAHWTLQGTHSISKATKTGFRVVVLHPSMRGDTLLRAANDYHWVVSWIGNVGGNCGMTKELGGDWKETKKGALYMDVDTSNSAFHDTPRYFTTLHGHEKHWRTEGAHTVYYSKASGFRVYIIFDECFGGTCVDKKVTAAMADKYKWTIHWVGTVGEKAPDASVYCVKDTNGHDASGQSGLDWKKASGSAGLFIDVDTSASHFQQRPTYVTSVTTQFIHWRVTGAGSVFRPAKDSFRLYLAKAVYAKFAKLYKWRVNYLGYDGPVDCQVSPVWTKWSECSKSCDTGAQVRTRTVFQESFNGGIPCPLTKQSRPCNPHKCPPVDCIVSNWTKWVPCSLTCGNGTTHHVRSVLDLPKSGPQYARAGRACPVLRQAQECNIDPCPVDCKVSGWSSWTPCYSPPSVHCGVGYRHRKKTVVIFPKYGGQACPPQLAQSKTCYHKGNCIGSGPSSMCGGATPRGSLPHNGLSAIGETEWKLAGAHGISVDVDTSSCAFKITPQYVVQVMGIEENAFFGFLSGLSSVTHPTKRGFRVTIWYDNLSAQDLLGAARDYRWYISWVGETGRNAGITVSGHTGWKQDANTESANTVYADVDATLCSFEDTPRYFTALHGDKLTERAQGALVVYRPSARGFRLYATLSTPMSPALAEASNWTVSWVGISASVAATKESLTSTGSGPWQKKGTMLGSVLYKKVAFPPSRNMYVAPLVIPSVELAEPHWEMIGAGSVSQPGKHGFKFLLGKVNLEISLAKQRTWRVNYLSYEVLNCKLSGWTPWSACSRTCAGGQQIRVRKVLVPHGRGGRKCPSVPLRQSRYCNWEQCIGVGPSNPCGGISSSTTGWMLNMTAWKAHGIGSIYTTVDTSACKFTHTPYYIADMVGERFHWQLTGSISLSRWSSTSFRVTVHHPRMRGLTLLRSAKMYNWRTSWIGEAGRNAGITRQGKSGWRQASSPDISDWTLQLDVDTSHCQYTGVPRYFTALVGDSGVYRLHGEHVVYRSTARGFRVYVVADRFVTTTIAERKRWAVAWMGTTDSRSGTSSMDWHIVRDASNNVQQMHGASGGSGVGVYIDVSTKQNSFSMPPVYVTSVIAPGGGVDSMWRMFGSSSVYDVTRTGFRVYQALAPSVLSPKEHQWRVNYFGYESNFCAVSPWGSWAAHCPCKFQIRRRTLLARKAGRACIKPPLAQNTLPCRCTSRTPTPAPVTARTRTYTAAAVPTPAPTKAPLADVTVAIAISTETVNSFSGAEKLQFRTQLAKILSASLYQDLTVNDVSVTRVAPAAAAHKGIVVHLAVVVPFNDNPNAVSDALLSQTFNSLLAEKLFEQGLGIMAKSLTVLRPKVVQLARKAAGSAASSGAAGVAAATTPAAAAAAKKKRLALLSVLGLVGLVYLWAGVTALRKRVRGANGGGVSAMRGGTEERTPLQRDDVIYAGMKGAAVAPAGVGLDDGGVFI